MMPQPDDGPQLRPETSRPLRTFEAYHGDTLLAYGDERGVHYLTHGSPRMVVSLLHEYGRSLLNSPVPPAEGVGFVLREGERYSGAV